MEQRFLAYLDLLSQLSGHLERLTQLSQQKAEAVRRDDLLALDEALKQEQVLTRALRGLEQKRLSLLDQLGLKGVPLNELERHYPDLLQLQARQVIDALQRSYQVYRSASQAARNTLECSLHEIERIIAASGVNPAEASAGYEAPGAEPPKNMKTDFRA